MSQVLRAGIPAARRSVRGMLQRPVVSLLAPGKRPASMPRRRVAREVWNWSTASLIVNRGRWVTSGGVLVEGVVHGADGDADLVGDRAHAQALVA